MMTEENPLEEIENEPTTPVVEGNLEEQNLGEEKAEESKEEVEEKKLSRSAYRIQQLNTKLQEQERREAEKDDKLKELEERTRIKEEPDPDNYSDHDKYTRENSQWQQQERERIREEAIADYENDKRVAKQKEEQAKVAQTYLEKKSKAITQFEGFQESENTVIEILNRHGDHAVEIQSSILRADNAGSIIDYFGKNPDKLQAIALESPRDQIEAVLDLKYRLAAKPVKTKSSAPNPTRSERGSATVPQNPGGSTRKRNETREEKYKRING